MPALSASRGPSPNGKKASEASTAPARSCPCSRAFSTAIRTASTRLICPAPIPIVRRPLASTMAFEVTCLHTVQAKSRSAQSASAGAPQTTRIAPRSSMPASRSWTRRPPSALLDIQAGRCSRIRAQDPQARLRGEDVERVLLVRGCGQHLDELPGQPLGERDGHRLVEGNDAAVGRDRIARQRALVRGFDRGAQGCSTRVRVFYDHAGRPVELVAGAPVPPRGR